MKAKQCSEKSKAMQRTAPRGAGTGGGEEVRKDKLAADGITNGQLGMGTQKDKAGFKAKSSIEEALGADERIEHILRQPTPSTDPRGIIADEDYEAPQGP